MQLLLSVFNIEVSYADSDNVVLTPTLETLVEEIRSSFMLSRMTLNSLRES